MKSYSLTINFCRREGFVYKKYVKLCLEDYLPSQIKNFQKKYCVTICKKNEFLGNNAINGFKKGFPLTSMNIRSGENDRLLVLFSQF